MSDIANFLEETENVEMWMMLTMTPSVVHHQYLKTQANIRINYFNLVKRVSEVKLAMG